MTKISKHRFRVIYDAPHDYILRDEDTFSKANCAVCGIIVTYANPCYFVREPKIEENEIEYDVNENNLVCSVICSEMFILRKI